MAKKLREIIQEAAGEKSSLHATFAKAGFRHGITTQGYGVGAARTRKDQTIHHYHLPTKSLSQLDQRTPNFEKMGYTKSAKKNEFGGSVYTHSNGDEIHLTGTGFDHLRKKTK